MAKRRRKGLEVDFAGVPRIEYEELEDEHGDPITRLRIVSETDDDSEDSEVIDEDEVDDEDPDIDDEDPEDDD